MSRPLERRMLKQGPKRSVWVEPTGEPDGPPLRLVKQFHSRGLLDRWRDPLRACREYRGLSRLRAAGLPAPEPLRVSRRAGRWELWTEHLEGACTLEELLTGRAEWPLRPAQVAERLGRGLAQLGAAGLRLADLHAGNVMIDGGGNPWLVDAATCRHERRWRGLMGQLSDLCAGVREISHPVWRARFLRALCDNLPPGSPPIERVERLDETIEQWARVKRIEHAQRRVERWLRTSGATRPWQAGSARGVEAVTEAPGTPRSRAYGSIQAAELAWRRHALLVEHNLPGLAPQRLTFAPQPEVTVMLPAGSRPLGEVPLPRALGSLLGALHDRWLFAPGLRAEDLIVSADGGLLLDAVELTPDLVERERQSQWREHAPWRWSDLPAKAREAFFQAYVAAHRGGPRERAALREELREELRGA